MTMTLAVGNKNSQKEKRRGATKGIDHPIEIHTEKARQKGDRQEHQRNDRQPIDLLALALCDRRRRALRDIRPPLVAFVKTVLNIIDLVRVVVQFSGASLVNSWQCLDADNGRSDGGTVAIDG